eukprot:3139847-Prymnesium_polylepis.1
MKARLGVVPLEAKVAIGTSTFGKYKAAGQCRTLDRDVPDKACVSHVCRSKYRVPPWDPGWDPELSLHR